MTGEAAQGPERVQGERTGPLVLVTAAGGNVGRELVPLLAKAGCRVRALRSPALGDSPPPQEGATEVVVGDIRDPEVISKAVEGVDSVFHVSPVGLAYYEREIGFSVIDSAIEAGVKHLVLSTVLHPIITALLQHETKRDVEEHLVSSPINWTILQPADYMQMAIPPSTFSTGELAVAWSENYRQTAVDLADVAAVAAKVLTEGERHYFARYELCGLPQSFNGHELAAMIERVCGRPISVKPVSGEQFLGIWAEQPGPPIAAPYGLEDAPAAAAFAGNVVANICSWYNSHDFLGNPNVLEWLLGRPPTTLEQYLRRLHAAALAY
jgi:uncharacterized protein YbjT (DUF2867 family)